MATEESGIEFAFISTPRFYDRNDKAPAGYKSVDFIFEDDHEITLLEIKRMRVNGVDRVYKEPDGDGWTLDDTLIYKFRDSFLWFCLGGSDTRSCPRKKVIYIALIANLDSRMASEKERSIRKRLPVKRGVHNSCCFCDDFHLIDVKRWNDIFGNKFGSARLTKV